MKNKLLIHMLMVGVALSAISSMHGADPQEYAEAFAALTSALQSSNPVEAKKQLAQINAWWQEDQEGKKTFKQGIVRTLSAPEGTDPDDFMSMFLVEQQKHISAIGARGTVATPRPVVPPATTPRPPSPRRPSPPRGAPVTQPIVPPVTPPLLGPITPPRPPSPRPTPIVAGPTAALKSEANFADTVAWLNKFDGTIEKIMQSQNTPDVIRRDVLKEFSDNIPTFKQIFIDLPSKAQGEQDELVENISEGIFDILQGADIHDEQLKAGVQSIYEQLIKEPQGQVAARAINNKMNELFEEALLKLQPAEPSSGESKRAAAEREAREAAEAEEKRVSALPTLSITPGGDVNAIFSLPKWQMERSLKEAFKAASTVGGDFNAIFDISQAYTIFEGALKNPFITAAQKDELRALGIEKIYEITKNIRKDQLPNYEAIQRQFMNAKAPTTPPKPTPASGYGTYVLTGGAATNVAAQPAMSKMTETQQYYFNDIKGHTKEEAYLFYNNKVKQLVTKAESSIIKNSIAMATNNLKDAFEIYQLALTDDRLTSEQKTEVKNTLRIAFNNAKKLLEESIEKIRNLQPTDKKKIKDLIEDLLQKAETESSTGMPAQLGSTGSAQSAAPTSSTAMAPVAKTAPTFSLPDCSRKMARGFAYKDLPTLENKLRGTIASIDRMKQSATENAYFDDQVMIRVMPGAIDLYDNLWKLLPNPSAERDKYIDILLIPLVELQSVQDAVRFKNSTPLDANWKQCLGALIQILQEHRSDFVSSAAPAPTSSATIPTPPLVIPPTPPLALVQAPPATPTTLDGIRSIVNSMLKNATTLSDKKPKEANIQAWDKQAFDQLKTALLFVTTQVFNKNIISFQQEQELLLKIREALQGLSSLDKTKTIEAVTKLLIDRETAKKEEEKRKAEQLARAERERKAEEERAATARIVAEEKNRKAAEEAALAAAATSTDPHMKTLRNLAQRLTQQQENTVLDFSQQLEAAAQKQRQAEEAMNTLRAQLESLQSLEGQTLKDALSRVMDTFTKK